MDQFWLISRGGASDVRFRLQPPGPVRVGRSNTNALVLPDVAVSREHALIEWVADGPDRGAWRILDRGSSSGTRVNGVPLRPYQSLPLESGDRVDFGPVALEFIVRGADQPASTIIADAAATDTEWVEPVAPAALTAAQLEAVLAASQDIHLAETEEAVARATVDAIATATGFEDAAFVRPSSDFTEIRVLASRGPDAGRQRFSRSVLRRAKNGPVIIGDTQQADFGQTVAQSIAAFNQRQCICVPVDLGERLFGMIYLADHGQKQVPVETLAALARSIGRVAALALSNMERTRMAHRLEAEQRAMFDGTLQALIAAIDAKDPYTRGHSARVAEYAWLIARAAGLIDAASGTMRVELTLPNPERQIPAGLNGVALITPAGANARLLRVPVNAIVVRDGRQHVAIVREGKVAFVPVRTGRNTGARIEVVEGLAADASIIVNPNGLLQEGQPVPAAPSP